jgi:hypothetical protein
MNRTIVVKTDIRPDRRLHIRVPQDVPIGPAEIVLTIIPTREKTAASKGTAADLARSSLFGMWADRTDIEDSRAYARRLRAQAEESFHRPLSAAIIQKGAENHA